MNGAESMLQTLINNGVEVCFANPGTSEMHMVAAMGKSDQVRSVLCLFEGVCSGAADGYGRMAGKPACTLLHLGPGLSNASANLHNAKKAYSPVINLVGDHATYHKQFDAPLTSDIISLAKPVSNWLEVAASAAELPSAAADAVYAANTKPGQVATLVVPADAAWDTSTNPVKKQSLPVATLVTDQAVTATAQLLKNGKPSIMLLGNSALSERALELADQIVQATGVKLLSDTFIPHQPRGKGRCKIERLGYFSEQAEAQIDGITQWVMVGTKAPVAFFAYPEKASTLYPEGSMLHTLAQVHDNVEDALQRLVTELDAHSFEPRKIVKNLPDPGTGDLDMVSLANSFAHYLPNNAIVVDEGATAGALCGPLSETAERHDWLGLTGGSIGYGLPAAIGAAVACPDRKVICLHGDGGAMYTIQSLWTMAREQLDICVIILANRKYQILQIELSRVGAEAVTEKTLEMMDLGNPDIDFVQIAEGMGVQASRAETAEQFNGMYADAMQGKGPRLIEAVMP